MWRTGNIVENHAHNFFAYVMRFSKIIKLSSFQIINVTNSIHWFINRRDIGYMIRNMAGDNMENRVCMSWRVGGCCMAR